jgi:hypothetical protein
MSESPPPTRASSRHHVEVVASRGVQGVLNEFGGECGTSE